MLNKAQRSRFVIFLLTMGVAIPPLNYFFMRIIDNSAVMPDSTFTPVVSEPVVSSDNLKDNEDNK